MEQKQVLIKWTWLWSLAINTAMLQSAVAEVGLVELAPWYLLKAKSYPGL